MITIAVLILLILAIVLLAYYFYSNKKKKTALAVSVTPQEQPLRSAPTETFTPHISLLDSQVAQRYQKVRFDDLNNKLSQNVCDGNMMCRVKPNSNKKFACKKDPVNNSLICDMAESSETIAPQWDVTSDNFTSEQSNFDESLRPANMSEENPDGEWGNAFNPQFVQNEQKKFLRKLQRSHKHRAQSLKDLAKFHEQQDGMVEYAELINPAGKTIREVYENRTAPPKAKPKKIKHKGRNLTTYEGENEMNSGMLRGGLAAHNLQTDGRSRVDFGNDFEGHVYS
jgi:hypothetical protein